MVFIGSFENNDGLRAVEHLCRQHLESLADSRQQANTQKAGDEVSQSPARDAPAVS